MQPARDGYDSLHKELVLAIFRQVADKESVDLDGIDVQVLEIRERRKTGAEVIQTDAASHGLQRPDKALCVMQIRHRSGLGQLNHQALRGYAVALERTIDKLGQPGIFQRAPGDIHCQRRYGDVPGKFLYGQSQHPAINVHNFVGFLRHRD